MLQTHYESSNTLSGGVFCDGLCRNERVFNDSKKSQLLGSTGPGLCEVSQDYGSEVLQKTRAVHDMRVLREEEMIRI